MKNLPSLLKKWRGDKTQAEAATKLGVPIDTYRAWEQGKRTPRGFALNALLDIVK